jgi:hypothetical protein
VACAKRTSLLGKYEKFYNYQLVRQRHLEGTYKKRERRKANEVVLAARKGRRKEGGRKGEGGREGGRKGGGRF